MTSCSWSRCKLRRLMVLITRPMARLTGQFSQSVLTLLLRLEVFVLAEKRWDVGWFLWQDSPGALWADAEEFRPPRPVEMTSEQWCGLFAFCSCPRGCR